MLRKRIDRRERAKYNKQRGYTWEVEKEAVDWVEALGEIEGARQALLELKNLRVQQRVFRRPISRQRRSMRWMS